MKAQKNDDRDAEAIAEAATRPTMRFVELKSESQLDVQTLHRARDRLVGERTALINQLRAVLLERGITIPQGRRKLAEHLAATLLRGSGWYRARSRPAASRVWSASPNVATNICASCSSTVQGLLCHRSPPVQPH